MRLSGRDKNGNFWMHGIIFLIYWAFRGVDGYILPSAELDVW